MATDIVAGLRILRGIGGEETFGRNYAQQSQPARRAGVSSGIWQAAVEAVGVLFSGHLPGQPGLARHPPGQLGRPERRPAGDLPGLRPLHGRPDPDLLRARPEVHPRARERPQGDRDLRAAPAVARAGRPAAARRVRRDRRRPQRLHRPPGPADGRGQRRARAERRAGRPAGPLPPARHRPGAPRTTARASRAAPPAAPGPTASARRARIAARDEEAATREWGVRLGGVDLSAARPRRRTPPGAGQRHRQRAVRGHPAGRHRPPRPADARAGRGRAARGQRRGRLRRAARGLAGPARRARARPVRWAAAARRAGARARGRRADPGAGRAHLRGRRPHRGPHRRAGAATCAAERTTVVVHRLAAVAAPRRPRRPPRGRRRRGRRRARRPARATTPPTAPWWPGRSTTSRGSSR